MILVDSSVWIAYLRGQPTLASARLEAAAEREIILVGDLILLEILQGARSEAHARRMEAALRAYPLVPLFSPELAVLAARHYRQLRELGITIHKSADLIIGTFCIEYGHRLLHDDRDFEPMATHLGLRTA